jgi:hypothetical protein
MNQVTLLSGCPEAAAGILILIYLLTAVGFKPSGSSTVYIYTQTIHKQHNETEYNTHITIKIYKHTIRIYKHNNKDT